MIFDVYILDGRYNLRRLMYMHQSKESQMTDTLFQNTLNLKWI